MIFDYLDVTQLNITNKKKIKTFALCCFFFIAGYLRVTAAVKMPAIFGDNMILQRNMKIPIWGWANPNEKLSIKFNNKIFTATATSGGKWKTHLDSYNAGGPYEMTIKGESGELRFKNILIGDVWVAAGQSNMEFGIQNDQNSREAIETATDNQIHLFIVPVSTALNPQIDVASVSSDSPNGKWVVCSPDVMKNRKWGHAGFSAVGYYFAKQIKKTANCPIGMIGAYLGGTVAQSWTSISGLQQQPAFTKYLVQHKGIVDNYQQVAATYPEQLAKYKQTYNRWNDEVGKDYALKKKQLTTIAANSKSGDSKIPELKPSKPAPKSPVAPDGGSNAPGNLYNGMVAPIATYGIKGMIWYQGENNGGTLANAVEYRQLFPVLIQDWRSNWGQGDFPFLFVQLANYRKPALTPSEGNWAWVREAQFKALSLPATGMAVAIDLGEGNNLHYKNKAEVGLRLALAAQHIAYGQNVIFSGPIYKSMTIEGNKIRITFDQNELVNHRPNQAGNDRLTGFGIAGEDRKFIWANASIDGNTVVVSADQLAQPVAVRYNWADNPPGNLYNMAGLPVLPFRTDAWAPTLK